jgi:hypothetical protein
MQRRSVTPRIQSTAANLAWRANRLRCMSGAEIAYRLWRAVTIRVERLSGARGVPAPDLSRAGSSWIGEFEPEPGPYVAAAERVASGRLDVFSLRDVDLGDPPRWNRDPMTGIEAPLAFGKLLDYRDETLVGDIKYLWEINRHLQFVTLAQAYRLSGDVRYLESLQRQLDSWIAACPYPLGANWSSALEPALRLINWSITWQLIGGLSSPLFSGAEGRAFRDRWLGSVHRHCEFVGGHMSRHSSANNHLIGEATGLFVGTVTWPHWFRSEHWMAFARETLEREAIAQTTQDGASREQAVAYHQFVLELLLVSMLAGQACGAPFSEQYRARVESMLEFLASIMDVAGNLPMIGDSDDAEVVRLDPDAEFSRSRSLLASGAVLFRRGDFKAKAGNRLDDKTRWLLGPAARDTFEELPGDPTSLPTRREFPEAGYYILGADFETPSEVRIVADAGPLGYQAIAAHGHADALAFTLSIGGSEFLIDTGTYAYHTQGQWRQYFRGTAAHNTLRLDGFDQSQSGGNFMWLRKALAGRSTGSGDVFEGWHDGYLRLADPALHRRRITFDKQDRRVLVLDRVECSKGHRVELFWHLAENCLAERAGAHSLLVTGRSRSIRLRLPDLPGSDWRLLRGSLDPIAGWVSRRFDEKVPTTTVLWCCSIHGPAEFMTEIAY